LDTPIADTVGGLTAALAVSAALHQKTSQYIDVSMLESVLTTMGWAVSNLLMHQVEPTRVGNENMTSAPSGTFQTRDGLINIAANQDRQWEQLVAVLHAPCIERGHQISIPRASKSQSPRIKSGFRSDSVTPIDR
jgi:crotonobetainyl-CoA:carnitine CoA-transferase CaiB-like acyl-CoA transferase